MTRRTLKTPISNVTWDDARTKGFALVIIIAAFILVSLIGFGLMVGAAIVLVMNIIDITQVGPNFWNILWIVLSSLLLLGGLRQSGS